MKNINCCICKTNKFSKLLFPATFNPKLLSGKTYSARRVPDRAHFRVMECIRCGMIYSSPVLDIKKISEFYKQSVCSYQDQIPYLTKTYSKLFDNVLSKIRIPKSDIRLLEVGCGNGFFLEALRKLGIKNVFGIELSKVMVQESDKSVRHRIKNAFFNKKLFPKESFDLICCFHTLDHVVDPNKFIKDTKYLLKKGGKTLFVVHDTKGLSVKLFGEHSAIFDIEHIYLFDKNTLRKLFEQNGFIIDQVFSVVNSYPLYYWIRMVGVPKFLRLIGEKLLHISGLENIEIDLAAGNIGIIASKD